MAKNNRIFLSPPHMGGKEMEYVRDAFESNYIAPVGPQLELFEREFAETVGASHAVALSSGTAALHLALRYVGVVPGDEVFCSSLTFIASATPILFLGAQPVFIDSAKGSWNMDPDILEQALDTKKSNGRLPRAVVVVHLYGECAEMDRIVEICDRFGVSVIEDAAEALGARYKGRAPGTFGQAGFFSFNGNKIITTSGGGMLVTNDANLAAKVRFWATQAKEDKPYYEHLEMGYNYRMSNVLAAIGRGQLCVLEERVKGKRRIYEQYKQAFETLPGIKFLTDGADSFSTHWLSCMLVDAKSFGHEPQKICNLLEENNIEARPLWKPLHMQPLFKDNEMFGGAVAEKLFKCGICLPSGTAMTDHEFSRVVDLISSLYKPQQSRTMV
jgi:pyridoxal phosphate-dependent aminotransferase EpsN